MSERENTNALRGFRCPNSLCRSLGPFRVEGSAWFTITDDGSDEFEELDFDRPNHLMKCVRCGDEGSVAHFRTLTPPPSETFHVAEDGAVLRGHPPVDFGGVVRGVSIELALASPYEEVSNKLPKLPAGYAAFARRSDPDVDRQVRVPINERIHAEYGGTGVRGPVVFVLRSLLRPS